VHHRSDVGHGAAHSYQGVRPGAAVESAEICRDGRQDLADHLGRYGFREPEPLRIANRTHVDAETRVHL